jgi:hypothetical protein
MLTFCSTVKHSTSNIRAVEKGANVSMGVDWKRSTENSKASSCRLTKQNILSLSKETVLLVVNQTIRELSVLKTIPKEPETCNVLECCNNSKINSTTKLVCLKKSKGRKSA